MTTHRRRWAALLAAGALTLSLAACDDGGSEEAATTGGATSQAVVTAAEGEEVPAEDFMALLRSPGEEKLSSYSMSVTSGAGGQTMTMKGDVDRSGGDIAFDVDLDIAGMGKIQVILAGGELYLSMPGVTDEGKYMLVPEEQLGDFGDQLDEFDITAMWSSWDDATTVLYVGEDDVDGRAMRHYEVTADADVIADAAGQTAGADEDTDEGADTDSATATGDGDGEQTVFDVWLDGDNLLRKVTFEREGAVTEILIDGWGEPMDIQAPAPEDVQDAGVTSDS